MNRQTTDWENILATSRPEKQFVYWLFKEVPQISCEKLNNLIFKNRQRIEQMSHKEETQNVNKYVKVTVYS